MHCRPKKVLQHSMRFCRDFHSVNWVDESRCRLVWMLWLQSLCRPVRTVNEGHRFVSSSHAIRDRGDERETDDKPKAGMR